MSEKLKKEDRAFLYFRENSRGLVNVRFGPDKYGKDTGRMSQVLVSGTLSCFSMFSLLTKNEPLDVRMAQHESIKMNYIAMLDTAFPDVFEEKKRITGLEEMAIERAEANDTLSKEYLEKVEEAKEKIKERTKNRNKGKSVLENQKEFLERVEDQMEQMEKVEEFLIKKTDGPITLDQEEEEMFYILRAMVKDKKEELKKLHSDVSSD